MKRGPQLHPLGAAHTQLGHTQEECKTKRGKRSEHEMNGLDEFKRKGNTRVLRARHVNDVVVVGWGGPRPRGYVVWKA